MLSTAAQARFMKGLEGIIRPDHLADDTGTLGGYAKDCSFARERMPWLAVYPQNREQVQHIVKLANEYRIPLVPVSSGPPRFRGDTVPAENGVIVDFGRMKRIIKVDPISRYAMIEPGVTYAELVPELKKHGLRLCTPLLPRSTKSVVTSRLEREPVLIPKYQYDDVDPLLTLEVVYGTGDDFRTGSASGPGPLETLKADKVNPWGPGAIDFFRFVSGAQGTMGLVTWAVVKTEVLPSLRKLYFIPLSQPEELAAPMDLLLRRRVVDECLALNNVSLAAMLAESLPGDWESLKAALPAWTIIACIAGYERYPEERVAVQERYLRDICRGLNLKPEPLLPGAEDRFDEVSELLSVPWRKEPYWKLRRKGSCHDIFFLAPIRKAPEYIRLMNSFVARNRYPADEVGCYVQPMVQGRGCHCEFNLPCDQADDQEAAEVQRLFIDASETLIRKGAFFSRPYGPWADMVYSRYGEGVTVLRQLKNIFDPNHILNPGKLCF
ncbi:MAG: FAD-binding oxidoreductase [Thermodesulfobacteriota bacterium]